MINDMMAAEDGRGAGGWPWSSPPTMLFLGYNLLVVASISWDRNGPLWPSLLFEDPQNPQSSWHHPPGLWLFLIPWPHCNVSLSA